MAALNGYDIASYQSGINIAAVPGDFVIVKATQGISYLNPDFKRSVIATQAAGKLLGMYHYAGGGGAEAEAEHFLYAVRNYLKDGILVLDWESQSNVNFGNVDYAKRWLDHVRSKTGITPFIYMSKSVCRAYNWTSVAPVYPLWAAQYKNYKETYYQQAPWTDKWSWGAWASPLIYQYTSSGKLPGYNGRLDLDIAYMSPQDWTFYAKGGEPQPAIDVRKFKTTRLGDTGAFVLLLQNALTVRGYPTPLTSVFDANTKYNLMRFQIDMGFDMGSEVDGVCGPQSWGALFS